MKKLEFLFKMSVSFKGRQQSRFCVLDTIVAVMAM
jgi:hypothetical protein